MDEGKSPPPPHPSPVNSTHFCQGEEGRRGGERAEELEWKSKRCRVAARQCWTQALSKTIKILKKSLIVSRVTAHSFWLNQNLLDFKKSLVVWTELTETNSSLNLPVLAQPIPPQLSLHPPTLSSHPSYASSPLSSGFPCSSHLHLLYPIRRICWRLLRNWTP